MNIELKEITDKELTNGYEDNDEGGGCVNNTKATQQIDTTGARI